MGEAFADTYPYIHKTFVTISLDDVLASRRGATTSSSSPST